MARWEQGFYDVRLRLLGELLPRLLAGTPFRVVRVLTTYDDSTPAGEGDEVEVLPSPEHPVAACGPDIRYEARDSSGAVAARFHGPTYEVLDPKLEGLILPFLRELDLREQEACRREPDLDRARDQIQPYRRSDAPDTIEPPISGSYREWRAGSSMYDESLDLYRGTFTQESAQVGIYGSDVTRTTGEYALQQLLRPEQGGRTWPGSSWPGGEYELVLYDKEAHTTVDYAGLSPTDRSSSPRSGSQRGRVRVVEEAGKTYLLLVFPDTTYRSRSPVELP